MKRILLILAVFLALIGEVNAQETPDSAIYLDIQKLLDLKIDYEKYSSTKRIQKADSALGLYQEQILKLKHSKNIYSAFINREMSIHAAQLTKESLPYKFINGLMAGPELGKNVIKKIDYYRIIQYYVFKKNNELLPDDFKDLKIVDKQNYIKQQKAIAEKDRKLAVSFLKENFSLDKSARSFINNRKHAVVVVDMKNYLNAYGLDDRNKKFIQWAIGYLIEHPDESLAKLDNVYEPVRLKHYVPKDL